MIILCTICARGGSKGVPKKNIRPLLNKPLIAYTIEHALACPLINRVAVSTDSIEIAAIAEKFGAEVPYIRPSHLATDEASKLPTIQHLVRYYMENLNFIPDYVVDLDPTSPLRTMEDIERCIDLITNDSECDSVITGCRSNKNPYFNMVELDRNGFALLSKKPKGKVVRRQDAPVVYAMNASVYIWKTDILFKREEIISGRTKFIEMPDDRSIDIDSETDFKLVELLMEERSQP